MTLPATADPLTWLGRRGTQGLAVSIFVGLAIPPLAAMMKPLFTASLFALLALAFLRVDPGALRAHIRRPRLALVAALWIMLAIPAACAGLLAATGLARAEPGLFLALIFQTVAPPIVASPAIAALMRLDAALCLLVLVISMAATPITATLFGAAVLPPTIPLAPLALGGGLLAMLAGAALLALIIRCVFGRLLVERQAERIDGLNVCALFVFAVAAMDGVAAKALAAPATIALLLALVFAISFGLGVMTALVFRRAGRAAALAIAVSAGMRNMGLMLAASGGAAPELTWLYFALAQFPIYLGPQIARIVLPRLWPEAAPAKVARSRVAPPGPP